MPQVTNLITIEKTDRKFFHFPAHSHPFWDIIIYTSGSGRARSGKKEISFVRGTIICNPPNIPHSETSDEGYTNYSVQVRQFPEFTNIIERGGIPVFIDEPGEPVTGVAALLHREFCKNHEPSHPVCGLLLQVLQQYLVSQCSSGKPYVISAAEEILRENIQNSRFTVQSLFPGTGLSRSHFIKLFTTHTGRTPRKYLNDLRLQKSKFLLSSSRVTIKCIAEQAGMEDQLYFSRFFKKHTGVSPRAYRER